MATLEREREQQPALGFTLPYPPTANTYYRHVGQKTLLSADGRDYKRHAGSAAYLYGVRPLTGDLAVRLVLYRPAKRGDVDNRIKPTLDALNGIAWFDDAQIVELHVYRREDKDAPRVDVAVWQVADAAASTSEGTEGAA